MTKYLYVPISGCYDLTTLTKGSKMNFEQQQARAVEIEAEISRIWDILLASKSQNVRDRCLKVLEKLNFDHDCYLSGDGI